jgi:hypothetical protein
VISKKKELEGLLEAFDVPAEASVDDRNKAEIALSDARNAIAAADNVLTSDQTCPTAIVNAVQDVDAKVFSAAYKGEPSIAALNNLTSLQKLPFSGSGGAAGGAQETPRSKALNANLASTTERVANAAKTLSLLTYGLPLAPKDFASSCIADISKVLADAEAARVQAPLQVIPSSVVATKNSKGLLTGQMKVQGGKPPYTFTPDNSGLSTAIIDSQNQNGVPIQTVEITVSDNKSPHSLSVGDTAGSAAMTVAVTISSPSLQVGEVTNAGKSNSWQFDVSGGKPPYTVIDQNGISWKVAGTTNDKTRIQVTTDGKEYDITIVDSTGSASVAVHLPPVQ